MESDPQGFLNKVNDKELSIKIEVLKAIKKGVLTKSSTRIEDSNISYKGAIIGVGLDDTCSALKTDENQGVYTAILKELKNK